MSSVILIPACYASTHFPANPLSTFRGNDGVRSTLIEHTWRTGMAVPGVDSIYVATNDGRMAHVCENYGAQVVMTSTDFCNDTERYTGYKLC